MDTAARGFKELQKEHSKAKQDGPAFLYNWMGEEGHENRLYAEYWGPGTVLGTWASP